MPEDDEKTSFIMDQGLYYYKVMPFSLKNADTTYQHLANKVFENQVGRNVEVYVDNMLVKSCQMEQHILDLDLEEVSNEAQSEQVRLQSSLG